MPDDFDWRHPNFGARVLGDRVTPQERVRQYVKRAPKRTAKKTPKTSYGMSKNDRYVWDKGMTFAEKAAILAQVPEFSSHVRPNAFVHDFEQIKSTPEQIMDILRNSSSHVQKYYGVYDDIQAEKNPMHVNLGEVVVTGTRPRRGQQSTTRPSAQRRARAPKATSAPVQAPVEVVQEPAIDLVGPMTNSALASAALMQNRVPDYSPPMIAMQHGRDWNAVTDMNGNPIISRDSLVGDEYNAFVQSHPQDLRDMRPTEYAYAVNPGYSINPYQNNDGTPLDMQSALRQGVVVPQYAYGGCILPDIVLY